MHAAPQRLAACEFAPKGDASRSPSRPRTLDNGMERLSSRALQGKARARARVAAFVGVSGRAPPSLSQRAARQGANLLSRPLTSERRH